MNFDCLCHVSEFVELGEKSEFIIIVKILETLGSCKDFCQVLVGYNITEFNYCYGIVKTSNDFYRWGFVWYSAQS